MRTKILLSAALLAAGLATSVAQQVYSVNAVGYVNVTVSAGYNLLNNPLTGTNNNINTIVPTAADGSTLLTWNSGIQDFNQADNYFTGAGWVDGGGNPSATSLVPGKAFFLQNNSGAPFSITFVGEVLQGSLTNSVGPNYDFLGSQVPQAATLPALGFPGTEGMTMNHWDKVLQDYAQAYTFTSGIWVDGGGNPSDPSLAVAEGFLLTNPGGSLNWTRNFSVNN